MRGHKRLVGDIDLQQDLDILLHTPNLLGKDTIILPGSITILQGRVGVKVLRYVCT